jgi:putative ABC transport system permease protein
MNLRKEPPRWIDRLIDKIAPVHLTEEIRGDLFEIFLADIERIGLSRARRNYTINGLGFLLKSFFWARSSQLSIPMLRSYFTLATRSLKAHKETSIVNAMGLIIAIASALVIFNVVGFEESFDSFHTKAKNIYRIVRVSGADLSEKRMGVPYAVPAAFKEEVSSIQQITSVEYFGGANVEIFDRSGNSINKFREEGGFALVEPAFFDVFDFAGTNFKWLQGSPETALGEPFSIVLTTTMARKYFGAIDPVGQAMKLQNKFDCKVTGVVEDFPHNTDFPFTCLISYSSLTTLAGKDRLQDWFGVNDSHNTFVVVPPATTPEQIEKQMQAVHASRTPKELHESRHYYLQKLSDMHHDTSFGTFSRRTISKQTLLALTVIAIFLLLTGCINYINLATAQSTLRSKEIGLRKVLGSNARHIALQYFTETLVLVTVSTIVALALSELAMFFLQDLFNVPYSLEHLLSDKMVILLIVVIVALTALSGLYPAIAMSYANAVDALKNRFTTERVSGFSLRKVLVVVQFTITQALIAATFLVVLQINYFQTLDMGGSIAKAL